MIVNFKPTKRVSLGSLGAFGGTWEDYCDTQYPTDPYNSQCKNKEFPCGLAAPWTDYGAGCRQLPK